jgi:AmiR/NasT family two-component response regulator
MRGDVLIRELRTLRVTISHPPGEDCDELFRHIQRIGCRVAVVWPPPAAWEPDLDILFYRFEEADQPLKLAFNIPVVAIVEYESPTIISALLHADVHGIIAKPIRPFGILSTLVLARSRHRFEMRLQEKIAKLEETLRTRRMVERAVDRLAQSGLHTDDAYKSIRRVAMERRVPMALVAEEILFERRGDGSLTP